MKRTILALCTLCLFAPGLAAQTDDIKMPSQPSHNFVPYEERDHGYWIAADAYCAPTVMADCDNFLQTGLMVVNGYRFSEYFKLGLGVGVLYMMDAANIRDAETPTCFFPLFLEMRGNIISSTFHTVVPYWCVDAGYQFENGVMFAVGPGMRVGEKRNAFTLSAGYSLQQINNLQQNKGYSGVFVRLGYEF